MAKLNRGETSQIRSLMKDERWDVMIKLLAEKIATIQSEPITGTDAFQTLRALHTQIGKVEGLKEFFDDLEKQAFDQ